MSALQQVLSSHGSTPVDPNYAPFSNVELLVNAETQGATSADFIDISTPARTITRNASDTERYTGGGVEKWGSYGVFANAGGGGSRSDWTVGAASDWKFLHDGTDKWELAFWIDYASFATTQTLIDTGGGTTSNVGLYLACDNNRVFSLQIYRGVGSSYVLNGTFTAIDNSFPYRFIKLQVDLSLGSDNAALWEDGNARGTITKTGNAPDSGDPAHPLRFGGYGSSGGDPFRGSVDDIRLLKGYWTTGDAVPTAAFATS